VSFYSNDPNMQQRLNEDQLKLDRLFMWQDVFKLPSTQGSAGKSSGSAQ
jgi:hypothetical protein